MCLARVCAVHLAYLHDVAFQADRSSPNFSNIDGCQGLSNLSKNLSTRYQMLRVLCDSTTYGTRQDSTGFHWILLYPYSFSHYILQSLIYIYTRRHLPRFARLYLYLQHHDARAFRGFKAFLYFRIRLQLKCIIYDMLRVYYMCVRVEWKKVLIVWSNYQICAYHSSWGIVRIVAFCIGLIYCGRKGFLSI